MSIILTLPIAKHTIWGGKTLRSFFGFPKHFGNDAGQAWVFSAQQGESSLICGSGYNGWTLSKLWEKHPELFRSRYDHFPFIISLVAPEDDLSIQVHPDESVARAKGYPSGKNEAWVFLQAPADGHIIYDHCAADQHDLMTYINRNAWMELVRTLPVTQGDTVYIPAGTLHALQKGSIVYEVQQATNVTYRFFDYDRTDAKGCKRPLQLKEAVACLRYDHPEPELSKPIPSVTQDGPITETVCLQNESFFVRRFDIRGAGVIQKPMYLLATLVSGQGIVDGVPVRAGGSFLVPAGEPVCVEGAFSLLTAAETQERA